jgi:AraC-like DNA-binding protein
MFYHSVTPSSDLLPYIREYIILNNRGTNIRMPSGKYLPGPGGGMVFNFGVSARVVDDQEVVLLPRNFVYGPRNRFLYLQPAEEFDIVVVKFNPMGIYFCSGISPQVVSCHGIAELESEDSKELIERLSADQTIEDRIYHLETFFRRNIQRSAKAPGYASIDSIVSRIIDSKGCEKLQAICTSKDLDIRTFRRQFTQLMGVPPKIFCRIIRINSIIDEMTATPDPDMNDLIFKYGYYDQAHFINDFRNIVGETPLAFRTKDRNFLKILLAMK